MRQIMSHSLHKVCAIDKSSVSIMLDVAGREIVRIVWVHKSLSNLTIRVFP